MKWKGKWDCERFLRTINGQINKDFTQIKILRSYSYSMNGNTTCNYAYLDLKDGVIVSADYGFGKYKGLEITNCEKCWNDNEKLRMKNFFTGEFC